MKKTIEYREEEVEQMPFSSYVYKKTAEEELGLVVVCPKTDAPKGCVFFIHGGGWRGDDSERLKPHARYAALNGAVGVSISYRLLNESKETDVRDGLKDCMDALEFVRGFCRDRYGDLPVTVVGDSAGGYYAACLGCRKIVDKINPDMKIADYVVDLNGIVDLTGKWNYGIVRKNSDKKTKKEIEREYSPLYNSGVDDAPVFIVHGERDKTVAVSDAVDYRLALERNGVGNELQILKDAAHAFILFDYRHENEYVTKILKSILAHLQKKDLI